MDTFYVPLRLLLFFLFILTDKYSLTSHGMSLSTSRRVEASASLIFIAAYPRIWKTPDSTSVWNSSKLVWNSNCPSSTSNPLSMEEWLKNRFCCCCRYSYCCFVGKLLLLSLVLLLLFSLFNHFRLSRLTCCKNRGLIWRRLCRGIAILEVDVREWQTVRGMVCVGMRWKRIKKRTILN